MDYRLEDLGAHDFEACVQALLVAEYGATVEVFPSGPDGGRDATYFGRIAGPTDTSPSPHVFQVKFMEQPRDANSNRRWFTAQVKKEMDEWAKSPRAKHRPSRLVFVTNVSLSGVPGAGRERVEKEILARASEVEGWELQGATVWDRTKVCRLIDKNQAVRRAYRGLIQPGDVLAALGLGLTADLKDRAATVEGALRAHARMSLRTGDDVHLNEFGQTGRLSLSDVAIDLPLKAIEGYSPMALSSLLRQGDRVLRPSVRGSAETPHVLLVGGPGQGKSTLTRLLTLTYQACLLADEANPTTAVRNAVAATLDRLGHLSVARPRSRRWPVRVDLAAFGDAVAGTTSRASLLDWIAQRVSNDSGHVLPSDLRTWLRDWPWLIVLDGFDEVAAAEARTTVSRAVIELVETAHAADADLMIVITTRPQGYADEFGQDFARWDLAELDRARAVQYGQTVTRVRLGAESQLAVDVIDRLEAASSDPTTSRLMRTPLQVMIMSLLLEQRTRPPQNRHGLFAAYYDVILGREKAKPGFLARLLEDHRKDVEAIHRSVGFELQVLAESVGDAEAVLPVSRFRELITDQLSSQGHEGRELEDLSKHFQRAATERLVMLVPRGRDGVGFELRSFQEFFAARWLASGTDDQVMRRFSISARSAHWRNVWLLGVGYLYEERDHLFGQVMQYLRELDVSDDLAELTSPGARLAVEILDDDLATSSPMWRKLLVKHALEVLRGLPLGAGRLGEVLATVGDHDAVRSMIIEALDATVRGNPGERYAGRAAVDELADRTLIGPLATRARQLRSLLAEPRSAGVPEAGGVVGAVVRLSDALPSETRTWAPDSPAFRFAHECHGVRSTTGPVGEFLIPGRLTPGPAAAEVVRSSEDLATVCTAIATVPPWNWSAATAMAVLLLRAHEREPVAQLLG